MYDEDLPFSQSSSNALHMTRDQNSANNSMGYILIRCPKSQSSRDAGLTIVNTRSQEALNVMHRVAVKPEYSSDGEYTMRVLVRID